MKYSNCKDSIGTIIYSCCSRIYFATVINIQLDECIKMSNDMLRQPLHRKTNTKLFQLPTVPVDSLMLL